MVALVSPDTLLLALSQLNKTRASELTKILKGRPNDCIKLQSEGVGAIDTAQ